jgi:hypothetical protein
MYRHRDPDRGRTEPVRDFNVYNGGDHRGENPVSDLMLEARIAVADDVQALRIRLRSGDDRFLVSLPVDRRGAVEVLRNGEPLATTGLGGTPASSPRESPRFALLEASLIDRRLSVALDGELAFARSTTTTRRRARADASAPWPWESAGGRWRSATYGSSATCIIRAASP